MTSQVSVEDRVFALMCEGDLSISQLTSRVLVDPEEIREAIRQLESKRLAEPHPDPGGYAVRADDLPWGLPR